MVIFSILALLFACDNLAVEPIDMATIEGTVSIGPLCGAIMADAPPNNPCGLSNESLDQIYSKYKVVITGNNNSKTINKEIVLNRTGKFTFEVPVGYYSLEVILPDGATQNIFNTKESLKRSLNVNKGQILSVEIFVDTGIL